MTAEPGTVHSPGSNAAKLVLDASPLAAPLLARVMSMMLARADCPVDRLHDALVICDVLAAHSPGHACSDHVSFSIATDPGGMEMRIGSLAPGGASALRRAVDIPGVGDILGSTADEVRIDARDGAEELTVSLRFEAVPARSRQSA